MSETLDFHVQSKVPPPLPPSSKRQHPKTSSHQEQQPRELPEYKAAIELELWKEQQEEMFKIMVYPYFIRFVFQAFRCNVLLLIFFSIVSLMVKAEHNFLLFCIFFLSVAREREKSHENTG